MLLLRYFKVNRFTFRGQWINRRLTYVSRQKDCGLRLADIVDIRPRYSRPREHRLRGRLDVEISFISPFRIAFVPT